MALRLTTLTYILREENEHKLILLAMKKRGFGKGKWNGADITTSPPPHAMEPANLPSMPGPGGKVEAGESIREAAARECLEESGLALQPEHLKWRGVIEFIYHGNPDWNNRCFQLSTSKHLL